MLRLFVMASQPQDGSEGGAFVFSKFVRQGGMILNNMLVSRFWDVRADF